MTETEKRIEYHPNGKKQVEETYKDGVEISVKSWDEDGNEFDELKKEPTIVPPLAQKSRQLFFNGEVHLLKPGIIRAKYSVKDSNCLIKVKNNTHVRCFDQNEAVRDGGSFPEYFEILAPMSAVNIISGELPNECLKEMDDSEYLATRFRWDGF